MPSGKKSNSNISRRDFLQYLSAFPSLYSLSPLALAKNLNRIQSYHPEAEEPHFFVRIKLDGGWDTSLCFDPWIKEQRPAESEMFIEYHQDEVVKVKELYLGPTARGLIPFAQDILVINGIVMGKFDQGHSPSIAYIETGSKLSDKPSFTVQLAEHSQLAPYCGIITNNDLLLGDINVPITFLNSIPNLMGGSTSIIPPLEALVKKSSDSELVKAQLHIVENQSISQKLSYYLGQYQKRFGNIDDFHLIMACFLAGVSLQADLTWTSNIDTHFAHAGKHKKTLTELLNRISTGLQLFKGTPYGQKGKSLYDHTTFLITSEFTRNPFLNSAKGKDHNLLTNAAVLIGKGIKGGRVIGGSKFILSKDSETNVSYQIAHPIDFETGRIIENSPEGFGFIYPENLFRTVAKIFDQKNSYFELRYKDFKPIPGV